MILDPVYSLTNKIYLMFKSNSWGQHKGFSARFTREYPVCGGEKHFDGQSLSIHSPILYKRGIYRRGYLSCRLASDRVCLLTTHKIFRRWEIVAKARHFITVNFNKFIIEDQNQCGSGFLELRFVHDDNNFLVSYICF